MRVRFTFVIFYRLRRLSAFVLHLKIEKKAYSLFNKMPGQPCVNEIKCANRLRALRMDNKRIL